MKPFWKYHAIGNDFIIMEESDFVGLDPVQLCNRHKGIGADGVLLFRPHSHYAAEMIIVNSDGSIAEMCGNGLRCFAHWLRGVKDVKESAFTVLTGRGPLECSFPESDLNVVQADLGAVRENSFQTAALHYKTEMFDATTVDMGNPHLVIIPRQTISETTACEIAQNIDYPELYKDEVNVEVVYFVDRATHKAKTVVYERGVGFTLGCGTGAAAIYSVLSGDDDASWQITFPGGRVYLSKGAASSIVLRGSVVFVYYGELDG